MDDLCRVHLNAVEFDLACGVQQIEISDRRTLTASHAADTQTRSYTLQLVYSNVTLIILTSPI